MANRLKKEDYLKPETRELALKLKEEEKANREEALAQKLVGSIPPQRRKYVLDILSKELATK